MSSRSLSLPGSRTLIFGRTPLVMGIVNVTPDSFSDGGVHFDRAVAVDAALRMAEEGAAIVDVGGESTRPGAAPLALDEEIDRVVPVIQAVRARTDVAISIDTRNAAVAEAALAAGADIVNDVTALAAADMTELVARTGAPAVLMHMRGEPRTMQQLAHYDDVVNDVKRELSGSVERAVNGGVARERILVDPGIGFAKTLEHNVEILARCSEFTALAPVVIGASRKAFVGHLTGQAGGAGRMAGSLAAVAAAARGGAAIVRVHDVRATSDFLRVWEAIEEKARR